jgi:hypothetical protein
MDSAGFGQAILWSTEKLATDEFTAVVDRQVAQIASHTVQKFVRKGATSTRLLCLFQNGEQFVVDLFE